MNTKIYKMDTKFNSNGIKLNWIILIPNCTKWVSMDTKLYEIYTQMYEVDTKLNSIVTNGREFDFKWK